MVFFHKTDFELKPFIKSANASIIHFHTILTGIQKEDDIF